MFYQGSESILFLKKKKETKPLLLRGLIKKIIKSNVKRKRKREINKRKER
jgi:hypothetical protein